MTLTCVGIDVSKGKSTVSALGWGDIVLMKPHDIPHASALSELADRVKRLPGEVRVVMGHTGRYWLPVAQVLSESGLFVCAVNPKLIRDFGNNKLRSIKNDKADSRKRAEGKPYYVYIAAGANKFLRQYYARVMEHLNALGLEESVQA